MPWEYITHTNQIVESDPWPNSRSRWSCIGEPQHRKQQQQRQQEDRAVYVVPMNEVVTLDTLTRPKDTK